jgi:ubiquinone/menaquinone biosynthesis C-methylase UbiE
MSDFCREVQKYYAGGGGFFDLLYQQVNRQALAPYFRVRLRRQGRVLDAGAGCGALADELGLQDAYYFDLTLKQLKRCRKRLGTGIFLQANLEHLPFEDSSFDAVICSNVLHYTGLAGLKELRRVTKSGGQLLLAFLEDSDFTRAATGLAVSLGIFPPIMQQARFLGLAEFDHLDLKIKDSTTIIFLPPLFQAFWQVPRLGLVALDLEKVKNN